MGINIIGEEGLELRMYFLVPYNITPIQQGIQAGHAALEYAKLFSEDDEYIDFLTNWKTWIVLNGGTTNHGRDFEGNSIGSLDQAGDFLHENDIKFAYFNEPDLNNALTAVCLIVDERVFNRKDYPDFLYFLFDNIENLDGRMKGKLRGMDYDELKTVNHAKYKEWIRLIGGVKNEALRELLNNKKFA